MECSSVDLPDPLSPVSMISGWERSTIIGIWKFRFTKTGWASIFKYIAGFSINRDWPRDCSTHGMHHAVAPPGRRVRKWSIVGAALLAAGALVILAISA